MIDNTGSYIQLIEYNDTNLCKECYYYPCMPSKKCKLDAKTELNCYNNFGTYSNMYGVNNICKNTYLIYSKNRIAKYSFSIADMITNCKIYKHYSYEHDGDNSQNKIINVTNYFLITTKIKYVNPEKTKVVQEIIINKLPKKVFNINFKTLEQKTIDTTNYIKITEKNNFTQTNNNTIIICPSTTIYYNFSEKLLTTKINKFINSINTKFLTKNLINTTRILPKKTLLYSENNTNITKSKDKSILQKSSNNYSIIKNSNTNNQTEKHKIVDTLSKKLQNQSFLKCLGLTNNLKLTKNITQKNVLSNTTLKTLAVASTTGLVSALAGVFFYMLKLFICNG